MFVSFEGLDGAGKTTQVELLGEALLREGREVVATREPGGTPLGEELRRLLLRPDEPHFSPLPVMLAADEVDGGRVDKDLREERRSASD